MNELDKLESQIQADVDNLREQFSHTRDLYREVCALLFFRYGITPTTNKLYRLVRKGSMSVPTEALSNFWKELREKSKVRIEQPDLPEDLGNMAGELMAKIWTKAQLAADESLTALRSEIEVRAKELLAERDAIASSRDSALLKLQTADDKLLEQSQGLKELEQLLAGSEAQNQELEQQIQQSTTQQEELHRVMDVEVEKLQGSIREIKERNQNELSLLMGDIEREQSRVVDLETELADARSSYINLQEKNKNEADVLKTQLGDLRERAGELSGRLQLTEANNVQLNADMVAKEEKLKEIIAKLASSRTQTKNWTERIQEKKIRGGMARGRR
ncbi:MAG: DNA-binding protein [Methyloprofundus sp.]|nr:DNA-binding protein [Methyloprofundus sp.]